jgi:hypothetical protein
LLLLPLPHRTKDTTGSKQGQAALSGGKEIEPRHSNPPQYPNLFFRRETMIIIMKATATTTDITDLKDRLESRGLRAVVMQGQEKTACICPPTKFWRFRRLNPFAA